MNDPLCLLCQTPYRPKKRNQRYCSPKCQHSAWAKENRKPLDVYQKRWRTENRKKLDHYNAKRRKGWPLIKCEYCGDEFRQHSPPHKFCSVICQRKARWANPEKKRIERERNRLWHKNNKERSTALQLKYLHKEMELYPWRSLVRSAQKRAAKNGIIFALDFEWAKARWTGKCEITGIPFDENRSGRMHRIFFPSIDRIDATKGYLPDNCRIVLWAINVFKSNGTDANMCRIAEALVANKNKLSIPIPLSQEDELPSQQAAE